MLVASWFIDRITAGSLGKTFTGGQREFGNESLTDAAGWGTHISFPKLFSDEKAAGLGWDVSVCNQGPRFFLAGAGVPRPPRSLQGSGAPLAPTPVSFVLSSIPVARRSKGSGLGGPENYGLQDGWMAVSIVI